MTSDVVPALAIGAVLGDSDAESMAWSRAIGSLSLQAKDLREGLDSPVRVSIVFHVDGRMVPNGFDGVRTGRFDKRASRLVVQAAIPTLVVEDKRAFLLGLLEDAITAAEGYVQDKGLADGLPEIRRIVLALADV